MTDRALISFLMVVLSTAPAASARVFMAVQAGVASSYDYPLHPSGERAVASDGGNLVTSLQIGVGVAPRWSLLAGAMYWSDEGKVTLPKRPENPDREVSSEVIPVYGGLRFRPGRLDQSVALHIELGAGAAILRSTAREIPPAFSGELGPDESAVEVAPCGLFAASLSLPLSPWVGFALRGAYLRSGDFTNDEALIVAHEYGGLREISLSAGVEIHVLR